MKPVNMIFKLPLVIIMLLLVAPGKASAQIPDEVVLSLQTGNAKTLAAFFNQNIELVILDNDNIYSRAQAEQIVNNFFSRNQPEKFNIKHQRGKDGAQYVIGELVTKQETFRVYFLLMKTGGRDIIHQLRIEKQE